MCICRIVMPKRLMMLCGLFCLLVFSSAHAQDVSLWGSGSVDAVREAIRNGADVRKPPVGDPPLIHAIMNPDPRVTALLLEAGADPNVGLQRGLTPLAMTAMFGDNPEIILLLAKAGANLETHDPHGHTPLMSAIYKNPHNEIIHALLKAGANPNARTPEGATPLMIAATAVQQRPELVSILCEAGADINIQDVQGRTALMKTIGSVMNIDMLKAFLRQGADVNTTDLEGHSALINARLFEKDDAVALLKEAGAKMPVKK